MKNNSATTTTTKEARIRKVRRLYEDAVARRRASGSDLVKDLLDALQATERAIRDGRNVGRYLVPLVA